MSNSVIFMFSGQGSQYYQMGRELFNGHPVFRENIDKVNTIVQDITGISIVDILYNDGNKKSDKFDRTVRTHPAIFMVEYALAQVLIESGTKPDYVLGASMGEFASAAISGIMSLEETIDGLMKQAEFLENYSHKGGMIAILHDTNLFYETPVIFKNSELASNNYDSHFVISGKTENLDAVKIYLKEKNIIFQDLPVLQGFHSSCIDPAEKIYTDYLQIQSPVQKVPHLPFISCLHADFITDLHDIYFWDVVRKQIKFRQAIKKLEERENLIYLDLGPSGTLANYVKYNLPENSKSEYYSLITPFGNELRNLEKIRAILASKQPSKTTNTEAQKMITYVFPGQGSQKKGMGEGLFEEFQDLTAKADAILGYSIKELCLEDPNNQLTQTQFTQPALYTVNAFTFLKKIKDADKKPDYVAGHSLGEYNAMFAGGAFDFETGLRLVQKRGQLMSQASGGGMAAVIGLDEDKINGIIETNGFKAISVANLNSPSQIVISGLKDDIEKARTVFEEAGAKMYIPLKVSAAFHSPYMEPAKNEFAEFINGFEFSELTIPVISNVHGRPYKQSDVKKNLIEQITHSVRWTESIRYLWGKGEMEFEEIGPGNVLSGLIRKIQKEAEPLIIVEEENDAVQEIKQEKSDKTEKKDVKTISQEDDNKQTKRLKSKKKEREITSTITPESLGDDEYKKDYNVKYAYATGGMYKGIASKELVVQVGKAGMIGYLGTGGLGLDLIEESIQYIQGNLTNGDAYGMNLICNLADPQMEERTIELFIKHGIKNIEAAAFMQITSALVQYRLNGLSRDNGSIFVNNRIKAKISRPEIAELFLSPAPEKIINKLLEKGKITNEQAEISKKVPMADDICVEADSGGHTDMGVASALMPAMLKLREEMMEKYGYTKRVRVGAAGGIGAPEAAASAFILGADFILTGSINQCTIEAGTSDNVKDLLEQINVQDTEYAPAGDMFEIGAKVQVLKKGLFFPSRANKLFELYSHYNSIDEIDEKTKKQLQERYFKRSFEDVYADVKAFYPEHEIERAEKSPKYKMSLIFRWYFGHSTRLAMSGSEEQKVDYQVHCGPALGAFNQWVKGTELESWRNRHVDKIGDKLMIETADLLNQRFKSFLSS